MQSHLSEVFIKFFDEKKRDYFSISELKDGLYKPLSNILGINIKKATQNEIRNLLTPYLPSEYSIRKKGNSIFLSKASILDIDLNYVRNHPKFTLDQIYSKIPLTKEELIDTINRYNKSGAIEISLISQSKKFGIIIIPKDTPNEIDDKEEIKKAYSNICHGKSYVKICELRRYLNWPEQKFDVAIENLWEDGIIELQGSSNNLLSKEEKKDSYLDKNNTLRILLLWRK